MNMVQVRQQLSACVTTGAGIGFSTQSPYIPTKLGLEYFKHCALADCGSADGAQAMHVISLLNNNNCVITLYKEVPADYANIVYFELVPKQLAERIVSRGYAYIEKRTIYYTIKLSGAIEVICSAVGDIWPGYYLVNKASSKLMGAVTRLKG